MPMNSEQRFHSQGTLLWVDIIVTQAPANGVTPAEQQRIANAHQDHVTRIFRAAGGSPVQSVGDALCACWMQPAPEHARLAFECALTLRRQPMFEGDSPLEYRLDLALGTGELLGDHFGPIRQFQVVGAGAAAARRVVEAGHWLGDVRMCGITADLLGPEVALKQVGEVTREGLPPFRIFALAERT